MLLVYITCENKKEAEKIARALLKAKLIGCANMWPINSIYRRQGKIEQCGEFVLLVKTLEKNYTKIEKLITKLHSYDLPIIAGIQVSKINQDYLKWLKKS
jgi:periplasmic divalent cation tolerance protein